MTIRITGFSTGANLSLPGRANLRGLPPPHNRKSLVPRGEETYHARVRRLAKTLLVLSVLVGLVLPSAIGRAHEVACDSPGECSEVFLTDCNDAPPCNECPPPDECPCDHEDLGEEVPPQSHDGDQCPSPSHEHHHHHHQCVCTAANAWLISDSDPLSLHPPLRGRILTATEHLFAPESPVFLLDRPPMA